MSAGSERELLVQLYRAAVSGANIESLTADAVAAIPLERRRRVWLFAFGKAARAMANAALGALQRELSEIAGGVVVAPDNGRPFGTVVAITGDHPIPRRNSFDAAARIGETIMRKRGVDLGIVLISGGASSMIGAPLRGMSEGELSGLYDLLLRSGMDIHEMNAVRKRFALWAAGRLALALAPARTYCFAVSDVPGDDLASIGSGPCVPDLTHAQTVLDILKRHDLFSRISPSFRQYVADTLHGVVAETPKPSHPAFAHVSARVIASNALALTAAAAAARGGGATAVVHDPPLVGDASAAGERVAEALVTMRAGAASGTTTCVVWGGETTVRLGSSKAAGGRCQELALSAAQQLNRAGARAAGITVLAAGTDGKDGESDAAGAFVDATTWRAIAAAGRDPAADLLEHRSYDALASANALFTPGLTGTNVMDVVIGLVRP